MVVFCFFGARTLREACIIVSAIYAVLSVIHITGSSFFLVTKGSHWVYIMILTEAVTSLPFHVLLFLGAQKERATWVRVWLGYTLMVTVPILVIRFGVAAISMLFYWILGAVLELFFRVWMWFRVQAFYSELATQGLVYSNTFENPITIQEAHYDPPPPYRSTTHTN